ncbi:expressed unknown protein [Seminavis robusta]|uniref:Uncharacterized protein n=1 Tax=Seminavis robusta TaxID=568900 RepID=A0A9N8H374_9STRA|nr:expressed unknown protein [Seminavis robusta]|eukprot:Sro21_g014620.1 n/a (296) ;mRNA; f:58349-59317
MAATCVAGSKYKRRPPCYFKTGKLEWGYHVMIHLQCRDAYQMISLSPTLTPIFDIHWPWGGPPTKIAADHQPAFKLTIDILHYVTARVVALCLYPWAANSIAFWSLCAIQLWRCWRLNPLHVYPAKKFITHLQPWLLLVPVGMGVFLDTMQVVIGRISERQQDLMGLTTLLQVQGLCLGIAFLFTMAFRKYISMVFLFCASVAIIWGINVYVWRMLSDTASDVLHIYQQYNNQNDNTIDNSEDTDAYQTIQDVIHDNISKVVEVITGVTSNSGLEEQHMQPVASQPSDLYDQSEL